VTKFPKLRKFNCLKSLFISSDSKYILKWHRAV